jgi:hypothetical protein
MSVSVRKPVQGTTRENDVPWSDRKLLTHSGQEEPDTRVPKPYLPSFFAEIPGMPSSFAAEMSRTSEPLKVISLVLAS